MGSLYDTLNESLDVGGYYWIMGSISVKKPTKWINPNIQGKKYILHFDDDYHGPYVEEIRDDGYTTTLKMSKDKYWDFQGLLLQTGWIQV
jgi:hypothetical protein